ncbi:MAG: radical SAM protein, partial [Deltaproteobacteria bacterium]
MYEQGVIRPPSEASSLLVRVTRNCPWNQCVFCPAYKGTKFSRRTVEEVKKDLDNMAKEYAGYPVRTAFLQDGDTLVLKTEDVLVVLRYIKQKFPTIERVTSYARSPTLRKRSVEELKQLKEAGLTRIHVGMESGSEKVLKMVKKEVVIGDIEYNKEKIDIILEASKGRNVKIIAMIRDPKDDEDLSPEKSLLIAQMYVDYLMDQGVKRTDILLDPVVRPLEQHCDNGRAFLNTLELFKLDFPQVKTMANVSQLSEGLPKRQMLASYFVSLAISKGLDYIITNVLDEDFYESIVTTMSI